MAKRHQHEQEAAEAAAAPPKRFRVRTQSEGFSGERGGVLISGGIGFTSDAAAAQACRELGYQVEEVNE